MSITGGISAVFLALLVAFLAVAVHYWSPGVNPIVVDEPDFDVLLKTQEDLSSVTVSDTELPQTEMLFVNEMYAPEDFATEEKSGTVYMSLGTGEIASMSSPTATEWKIFARTGEDLPSCGSLDMEPRCGRPLGLTFAPAHHYKAYLTDYDSQVFDSDTLLLVADAYKGLLLVDRAGKVVPLLTHVEGKPFVFTNAMAVAQNGTLYVSDSSARFARNRVLYEVLDSRPTGRIIAFDPTTQSSWVVCAPLPFPNGLALTENDSVLLIALTTRFQMVKLDLATRELSTWTRFPGLPDNMELYPEQSDDAKSILWIGFAVPRSPLMKITGRYAPWLRKLIAALIPYEMIPKAFRPRPRVAAVDPSTGRLLHIFDNPTREAGFVGGPHFVGDHVLLGSWKNYFLGRLPRNLLWNKVATTTTTTTTTSTMQQ